MGIFLSSKTDGDKHWAKEVKKTLIPVRKTRREKKMKVMDIFYDNKIQNIPKKAFLW